MLNHDQALLDEFTPFVRRLTREMREISARLPAEEAQLLCRQYYSFQQQRMRSNQRLAFMLGENKPSLVLEFMAAQAQTLEDYAKAALDVYSYNHPVGAWLRSLSGIGPVLAAAHLAFIDVHKAPYAGHVWSYAGLTPAGTLRRGQKAMHSPLYKKICWLTGESFVKVSGREDAFYGQQFKQFKHLEEHWNDTGRYVELAAQTLRDMNYDKNTVAYGEYSKGRLPKAHLHARAKRRTVKLFLAHTHHKLYEHTFGRSPPPPYAMSVLGHYDYIAPPA